MSQERSEFAHGFAAGVVFVLGLLCLWLICFGEARANPGTIFADGFEAPINPCETTIYEQCVSAQQLAECGWSRQEWTWQRQWSAPNQTLQAQYPNSIGFPVPVGSTKNGYRVVAFTPQANQSVVIDWREAQAQIVIGYPKARPADGMWFAISPCPGDLRQTNDLSADPWLHRKCRRFAYADNLVFSDTDPNACPVLPGVEMYMTVTPHNPVNGPEAHTCISDQFPDCHVNASHTGAQ